MSNVRPIEIVELSAARFGVEPDALRGSLGRLSAASQARTLATYLVRKHTLASNREIAALFGLPDESAGPMVRQMVEQGTRWVEGDEPLTVVCELIEREIDALHGTRPLPQPVQLKSNKTPKCPHCGARRHYATGAAA